MAARISRTVGRPGERASWCGQRRPLAVLVGLVLVVGVLAPGTAGAQGESESVTAMVSVAAPAEACILISQDTVDFGEVQFGQSASSAPDYDVTSCSEADQSVYAATSHAKGTASEVSWQPTPGPLTGVDLFAVDAALGGQAALWLGLDPAPVAPLAAGAAGQAAHTLVAPTPGSAGAGEQLSFELTWIATLETPSEPAWTPQDSGTTAALYDVDFVDANHGWAVGAAGILATTDGGDSWSFQHGGTFTTVTAFSPTHAWAVHSHGILGTSDGGSTWRDLFFDDSESEIYPGIKRYWPHSVTTVVGGPPYAWAVGNNGTRLLSTDGGNTWRDENFQADPEWPHLRRVATNYGGLWAVGRGGRIMQVRNPLSTDWEQWPSVTANDLWDVVLGDDERGDAWAVGDFGTILATTDDWSWDTWTSQFSGTTNHLHGVAFVDTDRLWAVGDGGTILATTNGGTTWTPQASGSTSGLRGVSFVSSDRGWAVGLDGTILAYR
jgi:photosystem II stability/assembly factor-like uncharacterized protein